MVKSVDIRSRIESCTSDKKAVAWYAKIDGRIFVSKKGRRTFNRRCDLVNSIKESNIKYAINELTTNYVDFFKEENNYKYQEEVRKRYWDAFIDGRCQICKINLP